MCNQLKRIACQATSIGKIIQITSNHTFKSQLQS